MIKTRKLNCGITLVMEHIPYLKSTSFGIWAKAGAFDENKKTAGISHLIEHMMFKGTENRSAKEIAKDADRIGSQMNAFTSKEVTCYYIKSLASNIDKSIDLMMDMFFNSVFDKNELDKEKFVIYEEMKMVEDVPEEDIHDIISELVFYGTPLANPVIGTKTALSGITKNTIKNYIKNEYTKDSVLISVAGKFDEDEIVNLIDGKFNDFDAKKEKKQFIDTPYSPRFKVKVKDVEQTHICLGTRSIKLGDKRYYAFAVLNNILGGSMGARLFQSIREEKGLAYSVYSANSAHVDTGMFYIYAGVSHDKIRDAINAIKEELLKLKKDGVTTDELSTAKEQIKGSYIFSQESVNGRMFANGRNMTLLGKFFSPDEIISNIDKVSMDDIKKVSSIVHNIEDYSAVLITDKKVDLKKWMQE